MREAETWACGNCRSINPRRSDRCYSCRAPRSLAVDPAAVAPAPARISDDDAPEKQRALARRAGEVWQPTGAYAWGARVSVIVAGVSTLGYLAYAAWWHSRMETPERNVLFAATLQTIVPILAAEWLAGFVAWGLWLARVASNVPALGGGWPLTSPIGAFFAAAVPAYNLYWAPAVIRDVMTRLSAAGAARVNLVAAWWLALFLAGLPSFLPFASGAVMGRIGLRLVEEAIFGALVVAFGSVGRLLMVVSTLQACFVLAAAVLSIWLIDHIEDLQEVRQVQVRLPA